LSTADFSSSDFSRINHYPVEFEAYLKIRRLAINFPYKTIAYGRATKIICHFNMI